MSFDAESAIVRASDPLFQTETQRVDVADDTYLLALTWNTPLEGVKLVGNIIGNYTWSHYTANGAIDFESNPFTLSAEYIYGGLTVAAEYVQYELDIRIGGQQITNPTAEHYYGMLNYRFTDWFELGSYYSVSYPNKDDKEGKMYELLGLPAAKAWLKDLALTARFDINEHWLFKLEGHFMNGLDGVTGDMGEDPDENWFLFAAKSTFSF